MEFIEYIYKSIDRAYQIIICISAPNQEILQIDRGVIETKSGDRMMMANRSDNGIYWNIMELDIIIMKRLNFIYIYWAGCLDKYRQ